MKTYNELTRIQPIKEVIRNTKEFLLSIGWKFNEENNIWFKDGLKTDKGKFFFEKEKVVKIKEPKPIKVKIIKIKQPKIKVIKEKKVREPKPLRLQFEPQIEPIQKAPLIKKKEITEEIINTMFQLKKQGFSFRKIRRKTGVSITQVRRICKNIEFNSEDKIERNAKIPQETIKRIIELHQRGYNNATISRATGITPMTISIRIRKYEYTRN